MWGKTVYLDLHPRLTSGGGSMARTHLHSTASPLIPCVHRRWEWVRGFMLWEPSAMDKLQDGTKGMGEETSRGNHNTHTHTLLEPKHLPPQLLNHRLYSIELYLLFMSFFLFHCLQCIIFFLNYWFYFYGVEIERLFQRM